MVIFLFFHMFLVHFKINIFYYINNTQMYNYIFNLFIIIYISYYKHIIFTFIIIWIAQHRHICIFMLCHLYKYTTYICMFIQFIDVLSYSYLIPPISILNYLLILVTYFTINANCLYYEISNILNNFLLSYILQLFT